MAAVVDFEILWKLVVSSLAGGFGLTLAFSVAIYGATRFLDLRRDGRPALAAACGLLMVGALVAIAAGVVYGVSILADKG